MIGEDVADEIQDDIKAIESARLLLGFLSRPVAINRLSRSHSLQEPLQPNQYQDEELEEVQRERREGYLETWENARASRESPPPFRAGDIQLQQLPDTPDIEDHITQFTNQRAFETVVSGYQDWDFKLVPIESLVAFQSHVVTTAYQDIPTSEDGWLDVIKYSLPLQGGNYVMEQPIQNGNTYHGIQFASRGPNIDVVGPEVERHAPEDEATYTVSFQVAPRPNFIQVARFGDRFILKNGYHRCYQLLQAGETHVPAVVFQANNFQQTGAANGGGISEDMINGSRPPLLSDFDTDAAVDINTAGTNKLLRIIAETTRVRR